MNGGHLELLSAPILFISLLIITLRELTRMGTPCEEWEKDCHAVGRWIVRPTSHSNWEDIRDFALAAHLAIINSDTILSRAIFFLG